LEIDNQPVIHELMNIRKYFHDKESSYGGIILQSREEGFSLFGR
jgi:hypothetical protein